MARIKGNNGHNNLIGTGANDTFIGGGGNDNLNGGAGTDTALYATNIAAYRFSNVDGKLVVTSSGAEGKDTLTSIEALQFSNGQLTVSSGEFQVNTTTTNEQFDSSITALADGGFVVSWTSYQDGSGAGIYAQRYNAAGQAQGAEFQVNTYTINHQEAPSITALADGGFVVSWQSYQDESGAGIYAQRYNAAGEVQGGEFRVNTHTFNEQFSASITALADGGFVVSWTSDGQDGSSGGIYAQRYNAAGQAQGAEFQVNTTTANGQYYP
ncbi:MAG: hypothetical protein HOP21_10865, partial [Methylotenera sp.]|nr:hypothetical protein [Methylotenera sp.]